MAQTSHDPGGLIAGDYPVKTRIVTIDSGEELTRGAVLGRISADDEYVLSESASEDGSEDPVAILAVDVDASAGAEKAPAYFSGDFAADQLTFGTGHDAESLEDAWRIAGLPLFVTERV